MDILSRLDRQLLKTELYNIVRFKFDFDSIFSTNGKINFSNNIPFVSFELPVFIIPYDDTNKKFIILNDFRVIEIERFTNSTINIRSSVCVDPYKWHTFTSYANDRIFARLKAMHEHCIEWTSYDYRKYDEEDYNYEKYVKSM